MKISSYMLRLIQLVSLLALSLSTPIGAAQQVKIAGQDFNECLSAVDSSMLEDPGFALLVSDLEQVPAYAKTVWNINRPYRAKAINIIVPSSNNDFWPSQICGGLPREPADCITSPKERYIVCNPAVGRQLGSPLLHSRIASVQVEFAAHFILLTLFGHELGHIRLHTDSETHHLLRYRGKNGLKCFRRPANAPPTEEQQADEIGTDIACQALRSRPGRNEIPQGTEGIVNLISRLEEELDDGYFSMDDVCTGDADYPSVSRRKLQFSEKYYRCLYGDRPNAVKLVNSDLGATLTRIENWLTDRQLSGQIGSGNYGSKPMLSNAITRSGGQDAYVSYDSTGLDSALWAVTPSTTGGLNAVTLLNWKRTGNVVDARQDHGSQKWLLLLQPGAESDESTAAEVSFDCLDDKCSATERTRHLPEDARLIPGENSSIALLTPSGFQIFQDWDHLFQQGTFALKPFQVKAQIDDVILAWHGSQILILLRQDNNSNGRLYNVGVVRPDRIDWKIWLPNGQAAGTLESARFIDDHLLLAVYSHPMLTNSSLKMWVCPADVFTNSGTTTVSCTVYSAPDLITEPIALATRDFSSIQETSIAPALICHDVVVQHRGWLWLLDARHSTGDLIIADGIAGCVNDERRVFSYRARRVDEMRLQMAPLRSSTGNLTISEAAPPPRVQVH